MPVPHPYAVEPQPLAWLDDLQGRLLTQQDRPPQQPDGQEAQLSQPFRAQRHKPAYPDGDRGTRRRRLPKMRQSPHVASPGSPLPSSRGPGRIVTWRNRAQDLERRAPRTSRTSVLPSTAAASWTATPRNSSRSGRVTPWRPCSRACPVTAASARTGGTCWRARSRGLHRPRGVYPAGDAYYMPPGHVPAAETGSEFIQFSPAPAAWPRPSP